MTTTDYRETVRLLLELVAAKRPDALRVLIELLERSPAHAALAACKEEWQGETMHDLAEIAHKASRDLTLLERRTIQWNQLTERLDKPNLAALSELAHVRAKRTQELPKKGRREIIARRLERLSQLEQTRRDFETWLAKPSAPIAPERLARLLSRPSR